jgi:hypothetical protein
MRAKASGYRNERLGVFRCISCAAWEHNLTTFVDHFRHLLIQNAENNPFLALYYVDNIKLLWASFPTV